MAKKAANGNTANLDQRIAEALDEPNTDKDTLIALHKDVIAAYDEALQTIEVESKRALDLSNLDSEASFDLVAKNELKVRRMAMAREILKARIEGLEAKEYAQSWHARADQIEAERDQLAAELAQFYPKYLSALINIFERIDACDTRINHLHGSAPRNEPRRLLPAEMKARGLQSYTAYQRPIREALFIPYWDNSTNHYPPDATEAWNHLAFEAAQQTIAAMTNRPVAVAHHPVPEWSDDPKKAAEQMAQWNAEESELADRARKDEQQRVREQMAANEARERAESLHKYEQSLRASEFKGRNNLQ